VSERRSTAAVAVSEAQFTRQVLTLLGLLGWRAVHHRPARTRDGWRTAVAGSGAVGWPDIFAVRGDRALAVELKAAHGTLQHEQREWLVALAAAGIEVYVWKPSDWSEIEQVLGIR
jgi:Holliday junction resolvase